MRLLKLGDLTVRLAGGTDGNGDGDGPVVVLLHGFGAPADDLVPLAGVLAHQPGVRFAFPAAPLALPAQWGGGRAWWMIDLDLYSRMVARGAVRDLADNVPDGLTEARDQVLATLDALERSLGVPADKVTLGGFSQGAMLSVEVALRSTRPLAGLLLFSGMLLCRTEWVAAMPARRGLRVFQSHGDSDQLLPFTLAEELRDHMRAAGLEVDWVSFPGGHEIPPVVISRAISFLGRLPL